MVIRIVQDKTSNVNVVSKLKFYRKNNRYLRYETRSVLAIQKIRTHIYNFTYNPEGLNIPLTETCSANIWVRGWSLEKAYVFRFQRLVPSWKSIPYVTYMLHLLLVKSPKDSDSNLITHEDLIIQMEPLQNKYGPELARIDHFSIKHEFYTVWIIYRVRWRKKPEHFTWEFSMDTYKVGL